ncbi:MAG: hypothetical protein LBH62_06180 [Nitrososphaerota archaeon]|nr:hypothetical protein [Nitrososphaerota archaeon]
MVYSIMGTPLASIRWVSSSFSAVVGTASGYVYVMTYWNNLHYFVAYGI